VFDSLPGAWPRTNYHIGKVFVFGQVSRCKGKGDA
jgi:hypothetical protein